MPKISIKLVGLLSLIINSSVAFSTTNEAKKIEAVIITMTEAYNNGDHQKVSKMYTNDGEMFTFAGGIYRNDLTTNSGLSDLQQFLKDIFERFSIKSESIIHETRLVGSEVAIVDTVSKSIQNGQVTCGISIFTLVKVQQEWKIKTSTPIVPNPGHTKDHGRKISWYDYCKAN